jgi:hypothetical protein
MVQNTGMNVVLYLSLSFVSNVNHLIHAMKRI